MFFLSCVASLSCAVQEPKPLTLYGRYKVASDIEQSQNFTGNVNILYYKQTYVFLSILMCQVHL